VNAHTADKTVGQPELDDLRTVLLEHLQDMPGRFEPDELAYLALTQKVELHFRDRLAWGLHKTLYPRGLVVSREWRRTDLAILGGGLPLALVEAKALYTFDVHVEVKRAEYLARVTADLAKAAALAPAADRYGLVLVTNVHGQIPAHLRERVVKYAHGINLAAKQLGSGDQVRAGAIQLWDAELAGLGLPVDHVAVRAGCVWGLEVTVDAWLVGPQRGPAPSVITSAGSRLETSDKGGDVSFNGRPPAVG